jgi:hypothetical protein
VENRFDCEEKVIEEREETKQEMESKNMKELVLE